MPQFPRIHSIMLAASSTMPEASLIMLHYDIMLHAVAASTAEPSPLLIVRTWTAELFGASMALRTSYVHVVYVRACVRYSEEVS